MEVDLDDENININRKLSVLKHRKKQAANDAQLLMNRIALIQKEEERARKKIEQTKQRASEIISTRHESVKRVHDYENAVGEVKQIQQILLAKNKEQETEGKAARAQRIGMLMNKRKEDVFELKMEKQYLTQVMIEEQEKELRKKQIRREEIRKMEEEMKLRKEEEKREKERKMKELYAQKLQEEALEAKRAEKLVKALEKKERQWIERLRNSQTMQEMAFTELESALINDDVLPSIHNNNNNNSRVNSSMSQGHDMRSSMQNMSLDSENGFNQSKTNSARSNSAGRRGLSTGSKVTPGSKGSSKKSLKFP
eukprot:gene5062-7066_t